uniref:Uncharacterized protein LOC114325914 isoform X2 n=1 Tax=Diabrotica virgifera virgifera TaxID=50390 RepID=A0A6P7F3B8_DIAVI
MFCFYFKHKVAAVFMGAFDLVTGTIGIIIFAGRKHYVLCIGYKQLCGNYLIFWIFHLVGGIIITSGIIWEKSSLILLFGILHLSMVVAFIAFTLILMPPKAAFGAICISSCMYLHYLYIKVLLSTAFTTSTDITSN